MRSALRHHKFNRLLTIFASVALLLTFSVGVAYAQGDPTGEATLEGASPATDVALTFVWLMIAGTLVFFMQTGFAFLTAGFVQPKNLVNILTKNFMDFCIGGLAYFVFGFGLMYGADVAGFIGSDGFLLLNDYYDVNIALSWFFQMVFAATAATIVAGAMAERMKITAYLAYSFLLSGLIYPISGHWVWGGGWLANMGFHDFAGSGVVHMIGGVVGLVGAWLLGPRNGKYDRNGTPREVKPVNIPYIVLGGLILFVGWFGFNPGSTLNGNDLRISIIAVNTMLAGITGATVAIYAGIIRTGQANVVAAVNGSLAGLVGITAACAVVPPWAALVIGGFAAVLQMWGEKFVERTLKVDDPVGAVAVHGICGAYGVLMVGVFADGTYAGVSGLIAGNAGQLVTQLIGVAALAGWALVTGFIMFAVIRSAIGLRASDAEQETGLDMEEHGMAAYLTGDTLAA